MTKNFFLPLIGVVLLIFMFSLAMTTPLIAQEENKDADIEDFSLEDLLNVEITTAGKVAEKVSDIPASVVFVTSQEIKDQNYQTVEEILLGVPGLFGINEWGSDKTIPGIRGYLSQNANLVIFLIDGVRQHQLYADHGPMPNPIAWYPVEMIERVEVIRGPMAVIYGGGAFFGVVNIVTKKDFGEGDNNKVIVSLAVGSKEKKGAVFFGSSKGDLKFSVAAQILDDLGDDLDYQDMSTFDLTPFGVGENPSTGDRLGFQARVVNTSLSYKGLKMSLQATHYRTGFYLLTPAIGPGSNGTSDYLNFNLGYDTSLSKTMDLSVFASYHTAIVNLNWDVGGLVWSPDITADDFPGKDAINRAGYEAEGRLTFKPSDKFKVLFGVNYKETEFVDYSSTLIALEVHYDETLLSPIKSVDLFGQASYAPSSRLRFVAGARFSKVSEYSVEYSLNPGHPVGSDTLTGSYQNNDFYFTPRVAAIFHLSSKNILKLLYGKAINHPNFWSVIASVSTGSVPVEPEFIQTFELNYQSMFSKNASVNVSLFFNKFDNLILNVGAFNSEGAWNIYTSNDGKKETYGAELNTNLKLSSVLSLQMSGVYQKTKNKQAGFEDVTVANSPSFLGYIKAVYKINNLSLGLDGRYISEIEPGLDLSTPGVINRIGTKVPGYFDLRGTVRVNKLFGKDLSLAATVTNIFGSENRSPVGPSNLVWADKGLFGRSRAFVLSLTYETN